MGGDVGLRYRRIDNSWCLKRKYKMNRVLGYNNSFYQLQSRRSQFERKEKLQEKPGLISPTYETQFGIKKIREGN